VAFLEFSCFKAVLTCPIEGVGGFSCLSDDATSSRLGIMVSGSFDRGLVNIFCSISTVSGVPSEIKLLFRLSPSKPANWDIVLCHFAASYSRLLLTLDE
jgi:hypothetical protein